MNTEVEMTKERIAEEAEETGMPGRNGKNRILECIASWFPPGSYYLVELAVCILLLVLLFVGSRQFYPRMEDWKKQSEEMFSRYDSEDGGFVEILWSDSTFRDLGDFTTGCFKAYPFLAAWCIFLVILHYVSFYRRSKSVYVMKRLNNRWEMHRRCLLIPVICALIGTVYVWVMARNFVHIYNEAKIFKSGVDTIPILCTFL